MAAIGEEVGKRALALGMQVIAPRGRGASWTATEMTCSTSGNAVGKCDYCV
jgi:phosphoglycerate dehydrogenase-like enzyme